MKKGYNSPNSYYISSTEQGKTERQTESANRLGCLSIIALAVLTLAILIISKL